MEGRASRRGGGQLRQHHRRGEGRDDICCTSANAVEVVESIPADTRDPVPARPFLGALGRARDRPRQLHIWMGECHVHAGINGADSRRRWQADAGRGAVRASRMWLCHERAVSGLVGRGARDAHEDPVDGWHGRRRPRDHCCQGAGGHRDRHDPSARKGQLGHGLRAGEPCCGVQVHEDDHAGEAAAIASRRYRRGVRRP